MITYIRCPICGKLSKIANFHTQHEIPNIMTQEIKHPKGKKHFFLNIWKRLILTKEEQRTQLLSLIGILERRLQRLQELLELLDVELRIKPRTYLTSKPMITITEKPMITMTQKPRHNLEIKPKVELWVKG